MKAQMGRNGKHLWSAAEDRLLFEAVNKCGLDDWRKVAANMANRTGKQCRERWTNHVSPNVKKGGWSAEEDAQVISLVQELGSQWSMISTNMPGRSDNAIKNRYFSFVRRGLVAPPTSWVKTQVRRRGPGVDDHNRDEVKSKRITTTTTTTSNSHDQKSTHDHNLDTKQQQQQQQSDDDGEGDVSCSTPEAAAGDTKSNASSGSCTIDEVFETPVCYSFPPSMTLPVIEQHKQHKQHNHDHHDHHQLQQHQHQFRQQQALSSQLQPHPHSHPQLQARLPHQHEFHRSSAMQLQLCHEGNDGQARSFPLFPNLNATALCGRDTNANMHNPRHRARSASNDHCSEALATTPTMTTTTTTSDSESRLHTLQSLQPNQQNHSGSFGSLASLPRIEDLPSLKSLFEHRFEHNTNTNTNTNNYYDHDNDHVDTESMARAKRMRTTHSSTNTNVHAFRDLQLLQGLCASATHSHSNPMRPMSQAHTAPTLGVPVASVLDSAHYHRGNAGAGVEFNAGVHAAHRIQIRNDHSHHHGGVGIATGLPAQSTSNTSRVPLPGISLFAGISLPPSNLNTKHRDTRPPYYHPSQ